MEPIDDSEVTGVLSVIDKEFILSVGWSKRITKYDDSGSDVSAQLLVLCDHSVCDCLYHKLTEQIWLLSL